MWSFVTEPGLATATVDFTRDFTLLDVGLLGMMALAAGAIAFTVVRHHVSQRTKLTTERVPAAADHREAA
jgi:hypothetical protein